MLSQLLSSNGPPLIRFFGYLFMFYSYNHFISYFILAQYVLLHKNPPEMLVSFLTGSEGGRGKNSNSH